MRIKLETGPACDKHVSIGMRYVAEGRLPDCHEVPSRDMLIGPTVRLWPSLTFQFGHPGIGREGDGTYLFCYTKPIRRAGRNIVCLDAMNEFRSARARFEVEEILRISEELYQAAKGLEPRFFSSSESS